MVTLIVGVISTRSTPLSFYQRVKIPIIHRLKSVISTTKHMFEVCDKFNRALHDRQWPHSRGGNNTQGDQGVHHDFLMAVILQNVFNAWFSVHDIDPASRTFESMCTELANSLYSRSVGL